MAPLFMVMHFLMPKRVLQKYWKSPYFQHWDIAAFSYFSGVLMRTVMLTGDSPLTEWRIALVAHQVTKKAEEDRMTFRALQSEAEHKAALKEVAALMEKDPEPGTPEGDRLDVLVTKVQAYEAVNTPMEATGSVNTIKPQA